MKKVQRKNPKSAQWFVPAEITQNTIFMMGAPITFFLREWPKRGFGNFVTQYFTLYDGDFSQMWYRRDEFDRAADFLATKMLKNPSWALRVIADVERWSDQFIESSRTFRALPFAEYSNAEMVKRFLAVLRWHTLSHGIGASVSWHADADKERITKALSVLLARRIEEAGHSDPTSIVFSTLSTPVEESFVTREEREFLKLVGRLFRVPGLRAFVRRVNGPRLEVELRLKSPRMAAQLRTHYERWRWLQYGYKGPDYPVSYFLDRMKALADGRIAPDRLLRELMQKARTTARRQRSLERDLGLTSHERLLVEMTRRMVFIKEYRKGALYHGMFCYEPFFREAARRLKLTLEHVWAMDSWEIVNWLERGKSISKRELKARQRFAIAYATPKQYTVLTGGPAKRFFKKIVREEPARPEVQNELLGTCASPGSAKGVVKIIEVPNDMVKMKTGDILVSETTYPSLVPAMKKAAAIITNAGGLTCHAAIVSRELGIPCVVGTKVANKVLKDGDRVEVDATKGMVRLISKN